MFTLLRIRHSRLKEIQQRILQAIIKKGQTEDEVDLEKPHPESGSVTLTFNDCDEVVDKQPLFRVLSNMNVSVDNLKTVRASLYQIRISDWIAIKVLTSKGAVVTHLFGHYIHCNQGQSIEIISNLLDKKQIKDLSSFNFWTSKLENKVWKVFQQTEKAETFVVEEMHFNDINLLEVVLKRERNNKKILVDIGSLKLNKGEITGFLVPDNRLKNQFSLYSFFCNDQKDLEMFETVIRNFKKWSELKWLFSNGAIIGDIKLTDFDKEEKALEQILLQIRKGKHFQPGELIEMSTGWRFSIPVIFEFVRNGDSSTIKGRKFDKFVVSIFPLVNLTFFPKPLSKKLLFFR